jgi:hypothetical protein
MIPEYCIAGSTSSPTVLRRWKLNCWKTTTTVHDLRRDVHLEKGIQSALHVVVVIAVKALHKCLENFGPVLAIALLHHCTNNNGNCSSHLSIRCTQARHQFSLDVLLIPYWHQLVAGLQIVLQHQSCSLFHFCRLPLQP